MRQEDTVILLVDKPGHLRDALQRLIRSMPELGRLETADSGLLALKKMKEVQPTLVLVGRGLPAAEIAELTRQIKQNWPGIRCLASADTLERQQSARAAGIDQVLSNGLPIGQIFAAIQSILPDQTGNENESPPGRDQHQPSDVQNISS